MPLPQKRLIPGILIALMIAAIASPLGPVWWSKRHASNPANPNVLDLPPVIDPTAGQNNKGPANIGQAKHMARSALLELRSLGLNDLANSIEADLVGPEPDKPIKTWAAPGDASEREKQKAPLLIGQLKAIAHPFYVHLNGLAPSWLAQQRAANGTESGGIFPWTADPSDNNHKGMANLGQLKAVFSLHFTHDTDGDTLPDLWEFVYGLNPQNSTDAALDSDGDKLLNNLEFVLQGNPRNPDTNGDGIPDGWSHAHGHLPTANIASGFFQGGTTTNLQAYELGVQAHHNATLEDHDGDSVENELDADPQDIDVDWKPASVGGYALIEIDVPSDAGQIQDFNDAGHVLFGGGVWKAGVWTEFERVEFEGEFSIGTTDFFYNADSGSEWRLSPKGDVLGDDEFNAGGPGDILGLFHVVRRSYDPQTSAYGSAISSLDTLEWYGQNGLALSSFRVLGEDSQGHIFAYKIEPPEPEIWLLDSNLAQTDYRSLPQGYHLFPQGNQVTPSGWLAVNANPDNGNIPEHHTIVWNPAGNEISTQGRLPWYASGLTELPHGKPALAYYHIGNGTVYLLNESGDAFKTAAKLSGKNIHTFAGDGTAMTTDHKMWINGKLTPLRDLCPAYGDLIDEGWHIQVEKANKHGCYVISAFNDQNIIRPHLLVPVQFAVYPESENTDDVVHVSADDAEQELAAVILVPDMSPEAAPGAMTEAEDGTVIEWELIEGNGTISNQETTTSDGVAVTTLTTTTNPGDTYTAEAKVTTLKWNGGSYVLGDTGLVTESDPLEVVPGKAATIEVTKSKASYTSDATDEVEIEIIVKDQQGNLLANGTPVSWILDKSTGGFAKNDQNAEKVEFTLTDGKAKASLRAPTMPLDQNLITIVDGFTKEIPMTVERVSGTISSNAASLDIHTGGSATITVNAVAADQTPVYWFTSNGSITPDSASLSGGQATATLSTTGGRIGKTVVTATIGDRMFIWEGNITSSAPLQVSFENPFMIGGIQPGGDPPQNENGDAYEGPWFILTEGKIRAPGFGGFPATVTVTNGGPLVQVTGLDANNQITLDQNGYAEFEVASAGTPNQFGRVDIQVQVNPQGAAYVEIVETTRWTHVGDFFGGLIGLDTTTNTGIVTSIVGGYIVVGDVGAIAKNAVRNAGWSDKEPNNFEMAMAAAGIFSTVSGPGDGIVTAVRTIISRIGNSPLADVLMRIAKNIIAHGKLPTAAEGAFITLMKNDEVFTQAARDVLTDDKLFAQAARGFDKLGDPFTNAVKNAATTNGIGTVTAQSIVYTVGQLSDDVLAGLKNSGKLDDALAGMTKLVDIGVNPQALANTLNNPNAFTAAYKQADLLADTKILINNSPGIKIFKEQFAEMATQGASSRQGRTFEILAAARRSVVEAISSVPGKSATKGRYFIDVDFESATALYQVKRTASSLIDGDTTDAIAKLRASKHFADESGRVFKYVLETGEKSKLPQAFLDDATRKGVQIIEETFGP